MKGDGFALFSGGGSVEDIFSIILSYYEQELFLITENWFFEILWTPYFRHFDIIKMMPKCRKYWGPPDFKKPILGDKKCNFCL